jgi:magnesium transporter
MTENRVALGPNYEWIDINDPSPADLDALAAQHNLHTAAVQDCLDAKHLPKFERFGPVTFVILRSYDSEAPVKSETIQDISRKLAMFICNDRLITIHRTMPAFIEPLREKYLKHPPKDKEILMHYLAGDLAIAAINTYNAPIQAIRDQIEDLESRVFSNIKKNVLRQTYGLKRRANLIRRVLRISKDVLVDIEHNDERIAPIIQNIQDRVAHQFSDADEVAENITSVLNIYLAMQSQKTNEASHKTNEVMRLLTVISLFFMPLNFIAGLYGMNFQHMPELSSPYGYPIVLGTMALMTSGIFIWFRRQGWLQK